jgi:hypothetical protein
MASGGPLVERQIEDHPAAAARPDCLGYPKPTRDLARFQGKHISGGLEETDLPGIPQGGTRRIRFGIRSALEIWHSKGSLRYPATITQDRVRRTAQDTDVYRG